MAKRDVDVPYLEPLLFHLRKDPILEKFFTKEDFFTMPKTDLADLEAAIQADCPSPRSVWIFPGISQSAAVNRNANCLPMALHSFNIVIVFQCIRETFTFTKDEGQVYLDGQFMELSEARKALKFSINRFNKDNPMPVGYDFISWVSDEMLYPEFTEGDNNFLISSSVFQTMIL